MPRTTKERTKRWHDKRMRKKECNIGDKMLMNCSRCKIKSILARRSFCNK
jgi:hypothetical protein